MVLPIFFIDNHLKFNAQEQKCVNCVYAMTFNQPIMLRALGECAFFNHYLGFSFFQQHLKIVVDYNLQNLYHYSLGNKTSIPVIKRRL